MNNKLCLKDAKMVIDFTYSVLSRMTVERIKETERQNFSKESLDKAYEEKKSLIPYTESSRRFMENLHNIFSDRCICPKDKQPCQYFCYQECDCEGSSVQCKSSKMDINE